MNKGEAAAQSHGEIQNTRYSTEAQNAAEKLIWWFSSDNNYQLGQIVKEDGENAEVVIGGRRFPVRTGDLIKANPSKFDLVDNMSHLSYLNEPSILHNLKQRYLSDMHYTYSGLFLVAINPYKNIPIYTKETVEKYISVKKREDATPHIYAVASEAYYLMRNTNQAQTILITGESGAGKTENTKHAIDFLTKVSGELSHGASMLGERLLSTNPVLEAFGNARTGRNDNSSRFGKFIKIEFGSNGEIVGATVERYLLESSRVTKQAAGERNYHIFYALINQGSKALLSSLGLSRNKKYKIVRETEGSDIDIDSVYASMRILGITEKETDRIFRVLAAVIHLGELEFIQTGNTVYLSPEGEESIGSASSLLGVDKKVFKETLLSPKIQAGKEMVAHGRTPEEANFTVASLCKVLYERLFDWIISLVNNSLKPVSKSQSYIGVLDIAGFEILPRNGFEQLCINYTNEKLQQFFNHRMFIIEQETYLKEGLQWDMINFCLDLQPTIDLLETPGKGIFSILDEECILPGGTGERLLSKIYQQWKSHEKFSVPKVPDEFTVEHYAGKVCYNEDGWIVKNKDPLDEAISSLLLGPEGPLPLPLIRSELAATRFRTVSQRHKEQLNSLLRMLYTTNPHFVRCILPNQEKKSDLFDERRVLLQLQCNGVLEGVRISRQGFPTRIEFREFTQRYAMLSESGKKSIAPTKEGTMQLLSELNIPSGLFCLGITKLFLRQGALADLEEFRNTKISGLVMALQKRLRVLLSLNMEKLKAAREDAISLLQKNIKIYASVKNWSWWKLCMKVRPLLEVRKAEDEIKEKDMKIYSQRSEIQELKERIALEEKAYIQEIEKVKIALAQSENMAARAGIERTALESRTEELSNELEAAQRAACRTSELVADMKRTIEGLEVKVEHARKEAASEKTKKLLAELAALKTEHAEAVKKCISLSSALHAANGKFESAQEENRIFAQERDSALQRNKRLVGEIEDLQNQVKIGEVQRHRDEMELQKKKNEIGRISSLLSFEKEKVQRLNEAFKRASEAPPAPAPIAPPVHDNREEVKRLQKELEDTKETAERIQGEYEDLKKEYIELVDEKLGTMVLDRQKMDAEIKKLHQTIAHNYLKIQQTEEEAAHAKTLASEMQDSLKEQKRKVKALEKEISTRKSKEMEMAQEVARANREVSEVLDKMKEEKRASDLATGKREKNHKIIIDEIKECISYVKSLSDKAAKISEEVSLSMEVVVLYRKEIKDLAAELVQSKTEKTAIAQKLTRALATAKDSEYTLAWATAQIQKVSQEKDRALNEIEAELTEQRDRQESIETALRKEKKKLESEKRQLLRDLKEKERENASLLLLQKETEILQKKLAESRNEIQKVSEEKEAAYTQCLASSQESSIRVQKEVNESEKHKREIKALKDALERTKEILALFKRKEEVQQTKALALEETISAMEEKEKELLCEIKRLSLDKTASEILTRSLSHYTRTEQPEQIE